MKYCGPLTTKWDWAVFPSLTACCGVAPKPSTRFGGVPAAMIKTLMKMMMMNLIIMGYSQIMSFFTTGLDCLLRPSPPDRTKSPPSPTPLKMQNHLEGVCITNPFHVQSYTIVKFTKFRHNLLIAPNIRLTRWAQNCFCISLNINPSLNLFIYQARGLL